MTYTIRHYKFNKDLMDNPQVITTIKHNSYGWITIVENLLVKTFRGGTYEQNIPAVAKTKKEALKNHDAIVRGTYNA